MLSSSFYSVLRPIKMAENIVTKELSGNLFSMRPLHDKLRIVNAGRPTPPLHNVTVHHKIKNDTQDNFASLSMKMLPG
jgi:hypothetical protein